MSFISNEGSFPKINLRYLQLKLLQSPKKYKKSTNQNSLYTSIQSPSHHQINSKNEIEITSPFYSRCDKKDKKCICQYHRLARIKQSRSNNIQMNKEIKKRLQSYKKSYIEDIKLEQNYYRELVKKQRYELLEKNKIKKYQIENSKRYHKYLNDRDKIQKFNLYRSATLSPIQSYNDEFIKILTNRQLNKHKKKQLENTIITCLKQRQRDQKLTRNKQQQNLNVTLQQRIGVLLNHYNLNQLMQFSSYVDQSNLKRISKIFDMSAQKLPNMFSYLNDTIEYILSSRSDRNDSICSQNKNRRINQYNNTIIESLKNQENYNQNNKDNSLRKLSHKKNTKEDSKKDNNKQNQTNFIESNAVQDNKNQKWNNSKEKISSKQDNCKQYMLKRSAKSILNRKKSNKTFKDYQGQNYESKNSQNFEKRLKKQTSFNTNLLNSQQPGQSQQYQFKKTISKKTLSLIADDNDISFQNQYQYEKQNESNQPQKQTNILDKSRVSSMKKKHQQSSTRFSKKITYSKSKLKFQMTQSNKSNRSNKSHKEKVQQQKIKTFKKNGKNVKKGKLLESQKVQQTEYQIKYAKYMSINAFNELKLLLQNNNIQINQKIVKIYNILELQKYTQQNKHQQLQLTLNGLEDLLSKQYCEKLQELVEQIRIKKCIEKLKMNIDQGIEKIKQFQEQISIDQQIIDPANSQYSKLLRKQNQTRIKTMIQEHKGSEFKYNKKKYSKQFSIILDIVSSKKATQNTIDSKNQQDQRQLQQGTLGQIRTFKVIPALYKVITHRKKLKQNQQNDKVVEIQKTPKRNYNEQKQLLRYAKKHLPKQFNYLVEEMSYYDAQQSVI